MHGARRRQLAGERQTTQNTDKKDAGKRQRRETDDEDRDRTIDDQKMFAKSAKYST